MRLKVFLAVLVLATILQAKEPKHYQSGKLVRMESVKCGTDEKNGKSIAGEMIGTDSAHMKTHELLCQQYTLETSSLVYTVRPKDDKHPALLPIGENAQFRLEKDKMLLRVEDMDDKEREYIVVSILPKGQAETAHNLTPGRVTERLRIEIEAAEWLFQPLCLALPQTALKCNTLNNLG